MQLEVADEVREVVAPNSAAGPVTAVYQRVDSHTIYNTLDWFKVNLQDSPILHRKNNGYRYTLW